MQATDWAYLAGFFDGEGSVGVYESRGTFCLRVQISQRKTRLTERLLNEMVRLFGGSVSAVNKDRPGLLWQVSGDRAAAFLRSVQPWLYLKGPQADVAIEWQAGRASVRRDERGRILPKSEEETRRGREAVQLLKEMKREA